MNTPHNKNFTLRKMNEDDFPHCQWLREQVGWNQTLNDWKRFLSYDPEGCFVAEKDGTVVGTACTIPYENRFGWIAMVIVDPGQRRLGIGTALLHAGFNHLENKGLTVKLDATPDGKLLYDTLGFQDEYGLARWEGEAVTVPAPTSNCKPLRLQVLDQWDAYDAPIFGASRKQVLESYLQFYPSLGFAIEEQGKIRGYILAREGTNAFHVGPWVADEPEMAVDLFHMLISTRNPQRVFIDILDPNPHIHTILESFGFHQQRPFIRMYRGKNLWPGIPELIYGITGPELG